MRPNQALQISTRHASHAPRFAGLPGSARAGRSRRGSVLILVVAMLVLVALMGTAMISTTRNDRFTATQNTINSRSQLLMDGVLEMTKAAIVADLFDRTGVTFRPDGNNDSTTAGGYQDFDHLNMDVTDQRIEPGKGAPRDTWLAARLPELMDPTVVMSISTNPPVWPTITAPLSSTQFVIDTSSSTKYAAFESPYFDNTTNTMPDEDNSPLYDTRSSDAISVVNRQLIPTFIAINGVNYPAFKRYASGTRRKYLAGDADGDGIPDSGLVRIPGGEIDGVTYFYAVRIIDNNSAVNINTALSNDAEYNGDLTVRTYAGPTADARASGMFRDSVGLAQLLRTTKPQGVTATDFPDPSVTAGINDGAELRAVARFRWNGVEMPVGIVGGTSSPVDDKGLLRPDFQYFSLGDAEDRLLASRVENPGYAKPGTVMQRFTEADATALAYRFCMTNPDASPSRFEQEMIDAVTASSDPLDSVYRSAPFYNSSLTPQRASAKRYNLATEGNTAVERWYNDNFDLSAENLFSLAPTPTTGTPRSPNSTASADSSSPAGIKGARPRRSILTALSATSNVVPKRDLSSVDALKFGAGPGTPVTPPLSTLYSPSLPAIQKMADYGSTNAKTAVNVAGFSELWRAYWQTMSRTNGQTPFEAEVSGTASPYPGTSLIPAIPEQSGMFYDGNDFTQSAQIVPTNVTTTSNPPIQGQPFSFTPSAVQHPYFMFRSSLRSTTATPRKLFFDPRQMMLLRAAQAAANTVAMRKPDVQPTPRTIRLQAMVGTGATALTPVDVVVPGIQKQPYFTEVYANGNCLTGEGTNPPNTEPYMAIELFNPYPQAISMQGWYLVAVARRTSAADVYLTPRVITAFTATATIPAATSVTAGGYLLLENYGSSRISYRPSGSKLPATGALTAPTYPKVISVPNLAAGRSSEVVLMRPILASAAMAGATPVTNPELFTPVDSFDFTGLPVVGVSDPTNLPPPGPGPTTLLDLPNLSNAFFGLLIAQTPPAPAPVQRLVKSWHYCREAGSFDSAWRFVYPGRYDGSNTTRRQQGTRQAEWDAADTNVREPFGMPELQYAPTAPITPLSSKSPNNTPAVTLGGPGVAGNPAFSNPIASYPTTFSIQILANDQPGFNAMVASPTQFPFGQIARNGDIMQVPYVSSYVVLDAASGRVLEMNSLPMDLSFAEDGDQRDDTEQAYLTTDPRVSIREGNAQSENPGRFSPINSRSLAVVALAVPFVDSDPLGSHTATGGNVWRYRWAADLLNYLTVQAPSSDYLPNVAKSLYSGAAPPLTVKNGNKPAADPASFNPTLVHTEDLIPTQGLININTAPLRVLAAIPWLPVNIARSDLDANGIDDNVDIANAIVRGRSISSSPAAPVPPAPYQSISDIERLGDVLNLQNRLVRRNPNGPGVAEGDFSPFSTGSDEVAFDFEEQHLILDRVSNLITTRSDTYTVYLLVQGWRTNTVGTDKPELVAERRDAVFIDRSAVTAGNTSPKVIRIPTE